MKSFICLATLSFVVLMSFGMNVQAQSKEVTEGIAYANYVTIKALPLDEGRARVHYDAIGIALSSTGSGLFHQATVRAIGGFIAEIGKYNDDRGWGVFNLENGDKVFYTQQGAGDMKTGEGGGGKITATITGGTGKCAGIKGSATLTRYALSHPAVEGIAQVIMKGNITYTLP